VSALNPAERFRIRRLRRTGPGTVAPHRLDWLSILSAHAGAVYQVRSEERALTAAEIERALRRGSLGSGDLVRACGGWEPLLAHPDFGDAATRRERIERWQLLGKYGLQLAGVALLHLLWWWTQRA
jgi:hypothetical protein